MTESAVSVIVACRDRAALLAASLPSLRATLRPGDELVVVDAASRSPDVARVAEAAGAVVVRSTRPGASAARNVGWRAARHDLLAFTDDDCRPAPSWLAEIAQALAALDAVCGRVEAEGDGHLSVLEEPTARSYRLDDDPAGFGHGANTGVRRSALESVDGWDERLGPGTRWPGGEDKELVVRLLTSGCRVGYRPEPLVRHLQWRTRRQSLRAELGYAKGTGALAAQGIGLSTGQRVKSELLTGARDLRAGYEYGALAGVVRAAGVAWGSVTARGLTR